MVSPIAGLGRLLSKDTRDHNYLLPRRPEAAEVRHKYWTDKVVLDQGDSPQCVGYAGYGWLLSYPVHNVPKFTATDLYHNAQRNDEWDGEDYDGTSVRGLFKALKLLGYVGAYNWAFDGETIVDHLLVKGPVVVGTVWTQGMFAADHDGFIDDIGGEVVGGHAYLLVGANRDKVTPHGGVGAVRMVNSWGPNWVDHGRAWISFAALDWLMQQEGEAATAVELKVI